MDARSFVSYDYGPSPTDRSIFYTSKQLYVRLIYERLLKCWEDELRKLTLFIVILNLSLFTAFYERTKRKMKLTEKSCMASEDANIILHGVRRVQNIICRTYRVRENRNNIGNQVGAITYGSGRQHNSVRDVRVSR